MMKRRPGVWRSWSAALLWLLVLAALSVGVGLVAYELLMAVVG